MSYRAARRAFIAACEKAHVETVARLQPGKAPDGMPLFMDCAALGPRTATRAVLAVGHDAKDSTVLIALLSETPPPGTRLKAAELHNLERTGNREGRKTLLVMDEASLTGASARRIFVESVAFTVLVAKPGAVITR